MRVIFGAAAKILDSFLPFGVLRLYRYLTSQTVTFYKNVDQSEISVTKRVFVSTPKLYKHDPVFGCVCLFYKHEFS